MLPERALDCLPLFPLPELVLLPRELLPLHIFEPRYRTMLSHVLEHDGLIGMGTLGPRGEVHGVLGVGKVVANRQRPDGRADILLEHVGTVDLEEEFESEFPFRTIQARERPENQPADALTSVRQLILQLASSEADPEAVEALLEQPPIELVHTVARQLYTKPAERLAYLEAPTDTRVQLIEASLLEVLASRNPIADA